jgi:hypothetical protein
MEKFYNILLEILGAGKVQIYIKAVGHSIVKIMVGGGWEGHKLVNHLHVFR